MPRATPVQQQQQEQQQEKTAPVEEVCHTLLVVRNSSYQQSGTRCPLRQDEAKQALAMAAVAVAPLPRW